MYFSRPKGTNQLQVTLDNNKITPVAFAIIELGLPEGIRHYNPSELH